MKIGEKINEFDNLPEGENTLAKFESMFKTNTIGRKDELVEIGEPEIGDMREIFVGTRRRLVTIRRAE